MLERIIAFLDRLSGLPYWQTALLAILMAAVLVGGYLVLRPPANPPGEFQAFEDTDDNNGEVLSGRELTVHVSGAVHHPGVVLLEEGERVVDALEAAGGPLPDADLDALNLAQVVQDGQKVTVPERGTGGDTGTAQAGGDGKIDINTAGSKELEKLPGIGPALAERIISYREKKGGFRAVDELKQVSGIGEKKFEEIRDLVRI